MPQRLLIALVLALVSLAPSPSWAQIPLTVADYLSPTFPDGSSFQLDGGFQGFSAGFVPEDIVLDSGSTIVPGDGDIFAGVAIGSLTIIGTKSFSDAYSFTSSSTPVLDFTGGPPVVFNFGRFDLIVTPIASTGLREASFVLVPVPEPSSLWLAVLGGAGVIGCGWRRSWHARGASA